MPESSGNRIRNHWLHHPAAKEISRPFGFLTGGDKFSFDTNLKVSSLQIDFSIERFKQNIEL